MLSPPTATTPADCPDCRAQEIKGPEEARGELSYWRCLKCGLIWNPARPPDRRGGRPATLRRPYDDYWKQR